MDFNLDTAKIAIIGLGYVGLPLAVEFNKKRPTVGFDVKRERVAELRTGVDSTREVPGDELRAGQPTSYSAATSRISGTAMSTSWRCQPPLMRIKGRISAP